MSIKNKIKLLILLDYRNQFWLKANYKEANFDVQLLKSEFEKLDFDVKIEQFSQLELKSESYTNTFVVYQSTEDPDSFYKSYIEDCLLGLELKGAILIPGFHYFRAHNNKVFMEILRDVTDAKELKNPKASYYGALEEYQNNFLHENNDIKVFKLSEGAQSKNVKLLKSKSDFRKIPKQESSSFNFYYWLVDTIKPYLKNKYPAYRKKSHHRRKFILQNFVPGLSGDFKVLIYTDKYFVLDRKIKPNDFRASGSGLFAYTGDLPEGLLNYARKCFEAFDVPFMGLDIAEKDGIFYLIEFQFVHFGNYTLEKSPFHFIEIEGSWETIDGTVILEEEFAKAVGAYIRKRLKF